MELSPFFIKAIQLLLSLSLLIVLHELGHYIPAKIFKTRVEKFFLFFDIKFALFKKKIGETVYGIGWLPLGGYVKISGMIDESMDKEQMAQEPKEWEFRSKPAWQRLIIMVGGVVVNIVLGFLIYMMVLFVWGSGYTGPKEMPDGLYVVEEFKEYGFEIGDQILKVNGEDYQNTRAINRELMLRDVNTVTVEHKDGTVATLDIPENIGNMMFEKGIMAPLEPLIQPVIDSIAQGSGAEKAGLMKGDRIETLNGNEITYWNEFQNSKIALDKPESVELGILRDGALMSKTVILDEDGNVGVYPKSSYTIANVDYTLGESISEGFSYGYNTLMDYVRQFKYVFTKKGATQVGGFGAIGNLFPDAWNWQAFWLTTALISIILAFMNILPIPALDGGHVMFLLYEMISGRKPGDKFMEYAQLVGFIIILALVIFANGNDIYRAIFD